jgi:hypothetical protein
MLKSIPFLVMNAIGKRKTRNGHSTRAEQDFDVERRKYAAMAQSDFWTNLLLKPESASKRAR